MNPIAMFALWSSVAFMGEEYVVEARSWDQYRSLVLAPQLTFWMGVTLGAGFLFGLPSYWLATRNRLDLEPDRHYRGSRISHRHREVSQAESDRIGT